MSTLEYALEIAAAAHAGQREKAGGLTYFIPPAPTGAYGKF